MRGLKIFDVLKVERVSSVDGGVFYRGQSGEKYIFLLNENGGTSGRVGKVLKERKYFTGLFRSRYSSKCRRFLGDADGKFLVFDETAPGEITIFSKEQRKTVKLKVKLKELQA